MFSFFGKNKPEIKAESEKENFEVFPEYDDYSDLNLEGLC